MAGGEHSYTVTGVVNAGSYILCFGLRLIVSLYSSADGWNGHASPGGGGEPYHISYGELSPEFAVVAVGFRT